MNLIEISEKFPTELDAVKFLERIRWGKEIRCPYCKSKKIGNRQKDMRLVCKKCGNNFSVTTGTQIHNTRLPVKTWLYAIAVITDAKKGMSAMQLQRNLGLSYLTSWRIYHKLRELMSEDINQPDELSGIVEMDETYIGGNPRKFVTGKTKPPTKPTIIPKLDMKLKELKESGIKIKRGRGNPARPAIHPKRGRGTKKTPVVGIVQRDGNVVAEVMQHLTYGNLKKMIEKYVKEDDAILITDEYKGYSKIHNIIEHLKIDHKKLYSYKGVNTNSIESFWAIIERGIIGQYHSVSKKHLPKYIAEFVYKYNNRKDNEAMFYELVNKLVSSN
jgi:transposase-like protein